MPLARFVLVLVAVAAFFPGQTRAHHGGALEYSRTSSRSLSGTATKLSFQFPHVSFTMDVEENGVKNAWTIVHNATPGMLRPLGWTRESIKPGDKITVKYFPHVSRPRLGQMETIEVNGKSLRLP